MTQTIEIAGRTYSFTTEDAERRAVLSTLGSLFDSSGTLVGFVIEENLSGKRQLVPGLKDVPTGIVRASLARLRVLRAVTMPHVSGEDGV
jgi:hypothetical protein